MIIPVLLLVFSLAVLGLNYARTGEIINKGVSLKGGAQISVFSEKDVNVNALEAVLAQEFPGKDINTRALQQAGRQTGFIVTADIQAEDQQDLQPLIDAIGKHAQMELTSDDYNIEVIGSSLGRSFFKQTIKALIVAFMFMGAVVFYYFADSLKIKIASIIATLVVSILVFKYFFSNLIITILSLIIIVVLLAVYLRESTPSFAVILAIIADIVTTLAIVNLIGMKLSTAGIAAFLMLIGYSVDTDILLSTRILKRKKGTILERTLGAMKTGMFMTLTTLVAVGLAAIISQSETLKQIMIIVIIGLLVDVVNTWIQNAGLVRWYLELKHKKKSHDS